MGSLARTIRARELVPNVALVQGSGAIALGRAVPLAEQRRVDRGGGHPSGQTLTERIGYGESGSTAPEGFARGLQPRGLVLIIECYQR
jgi:hypothetical protein